MTILQNELEISLGEGIRVMKKPLKSNAVGITSCGWRKRQCPSNRSLPDTAFDRWSNELSEGTKELRHDPNRGHASADRLLLPQNNNTSFPNSVVQTFNCASYCQWNDRVWRQIYCIESPLVERPPFESPCCYSTSPFEWNNFAEWFGKPCLTVWRHVDWSFEKCQAMSFEEWMLFIEITAHLMPTYDFQKL